MMSQRDRHTNGGTALVSRTADPLMLSVSQTQWDFSQGSDLGVFASDEFVQFLTTATQHGLLNDLPITLVSPPSVPLPADPVRPFLNRLLNPSTEVDLPSLGLLEPIEPHDTELDCLQRDAVTRALATPDLCCMQGASGTGKSRTVLEIIRQAVAKGYRLLVLSSRTKTIDVLLEQVESLYPIRPLRCLGRDEALDQLSVVSARFLLNSQEQSFLRDLHERANKAIQRLQEIAQELQECQSHWNHWEAQLNQFHNLPERKQTLEEAERSLREQVEKEVQEQVPTSSSTPPTSEKEESQKQKQVLQEKKKKLVHELDSIRLLLEARNHGRWWSGTYWKAKLDRTLPERFEQLQKEWDWIEQEERRYQTESTQQQLEQQATESRLHQERQQQIENLLRERQQQLQQQEQTLAEEESEWHRLEAILQQHCKNLQLETPECWNSHTIQMWKVQLTERIAQVNQEQEFARRWQEFLQQNPETLLPRFRNRVNLVCGPISCVTHDPYLNDATVRSTLFDLVIVEDAHDLGEGEFCQAARRGKRWILVGLPATPIETNSPEKEPSTRGHRGGRKPTVPFFTRLWDRLYHPLWIYEQDRLCCRLHELTPAERGNLESESVADNPEIELRICTTQQKEPILAEVLFPAKTSLQRGVQFLQSELNELLVDPLCRSVVWEEQVEQWVVRWEPTPAVATIRLEDGVTVHLGESKLVACSFARPQWDRSAAESWIAQQAINWDSGRTVALTHNYRQPQELARWIQVFFQHSGKLPSSGSPARIHLIQVPSRTFQRDTSSGYAGQRRGHPPRYGGAGLEVDLADPKRRAELPSDFQTVLPPHGLINLPEADALIEELVRLTQQFSAQQLGVATLYSAQSHLLKWLMRQNPQLRSIQVGTVADWQQQEVDLLLISLTRSHVSRAVTYGDEPGLLQQLLPRARQQIYLFADPGTLQRRAVWEGACDHFEEPAASQERIWISHLVAELHQPHSIRVRSID